MDPTNQSKVPPSVLAAARPSGPCSAHTSGKTADSKWARQGTLGVWVEAKTRIAVAGALVVDIAPAAAEGAGAAEEVLVAEATAGAAPLGAKGCYSE